MNLEDLFVSFCPTATPTQRAICRVADGRPLGDLVEDDDVCRAFGGHGAVEMLPSVPPAELLLLSAIRSGKSLLAAALAIRASQTCDVRRLGPGEVPRVSVLSLSLDLARATFDHIEGNVQAHPVLRRLQIGDVTSDTIVLRHPSGRPIEVRVVAGSRSAASLVARWSAGVIFDEAPRMIGADDGVVNLDDARRAVIARLLPGAQIIELGSPWAPFGPVYDLVQKHWMKPSPRIVVIRATGPMMHPAHWTRSKCEDLRANDPEVYRTDVLAEFADPASSLLPADQVEASMRKAPKELPPPAPGQRSPLYVAAIDPAFRGNAFTLVVAHMEGGRRIVDLARQWVPGRGAKRKVAKAFDLARRLAGQDVPESHALDVEAVIDDIADVCKRYGIQRVVTDQASADAIKALAAQRGIAFDDIAITPMIKNQLFLNLQGWFAQGVVELPPDEQLRTDLLGVRKVVTQSSISILLPKSSSGRHSDYAPSVALALSQLQEHSGSMFADFYSDSMFAGCGDRGF